MHNNDLSDCQEKLKHLKSEFDEFVYLVSHDLRAPIRAINNLSEWIEEDLGNNLPSEVKHNLDLLRSRSLRLDNMLQAILLLSRVSRTDLEVKEISLSAILQQISADYENEQVKITIADNLPFLTTYYKKLQTVIEQLIGNAVLHSDKSQIDINIDGTLNEEFINLAISDNGPGITPEQKERIFSIFYTGQGKEESDNMGAGLTLVKHILEFVGGSILVDSEPGAGSTFIVNWPLKQSKINH